MHTEEGKRRSLFPGIITREKEHPGGKQEEDSGLNRVKPHRMLRYEADGRSNPGNEITDDKWTSVKLVFHHSLCITVSFFQFFLSSSVSTSISNE